MGRWGSCVVLRLEVLGVGESMGDEFDHVVVEESVDDAAALAFGDDEPEVAKVA